MTAEKLHIAEKKVQANTPGDGPERQVMARKAQANKAKEKGDNESKR